MSNFIHLTNKTEYSLSEGAMTINRIAELCESFNMPAVGISDTNNMFGVLEFSERISKSGVQPLIGCNIKVKTPSDYQTDEASKNSFFFLNLFAKNLSGYHNLLELSSLAYTKYPNQNAINLSDIFSKKDGIILLSGGTKNLLSRLINYGKISEASSFTKELKNEFLDNLYIEIQRTGSESNKCNSYLLNFSYENSLPIVATNEVYFESPEYYEAHDALTCIEKKQFVSQDNRSKFSNQHYFKSDDEMKLLFDDLPEAITNTIEISQRCSYRPTIKNPILPTYSIDKNISEKDLLNELSNEGLKNKFSRIIEINNKLTDTEIDELKNTYQDRLDSELNIIINMKYEGYFLIVADFIKWSKKNNIPVGPGRGSGAGSLVAWCLEITDLDPIHFGLIFERFLNPERVSMPDFDIDFCQSIEEMRLLEYVNKKYGSESCCSYNYFWHNGKLELLLRDVGRVLGSSLW